MRADWDYVAQSALDQLGDYERRLVESTVAGAAEDWQQISPALPKVAGESVPTYVLKAGSRFHVFVSCANGLMTVLDIVPERQIAALRALVHAKHAAHA